MGNPVGDRIAHCNPYGSLENQAKAGGHLRQLRLRSASHAAQMPRVRDDSGQQRKADDMKRLRRIAWNGLAALSAVLCLWASGRSIGDSSQRPFVLLHGSSGTDVWVGGGIAIGNAPAAGLAVDFIDRLERLAGFQYVHFVPQRGQHPKTIWLVLLPYWFVIGALAALPLAWIAAFIKRRRRLVAKLCVECGYDLRASSERCPECGTITKSKGTP